VFRRSFDLDANTKILDLGSETGSNIHSVLQGTLVKPDNIYIADIDPEQIQVGTKQYGYVPVLIGESGTLPFEDHFFDIVYCSSVIEHATIPKDQVWALSSGREFQTRAIARQRQFADEIQRLAHQYFVQTPYKHFPFESHSWLPFVSWIPRRMLVPLLRITNTFWVKKTAPDWHLLGKSDFADMFPGALIIEEKWCGLVKSLMAIKSTKSGAAGCFQVLPNAH
jgi:SAM-dependent methyltransferase